MGRCEYSEYPTPHSLAQWAHQALAVELRDAREQRLVAAQRRAELVQRRRRRLPVSHLGQFPLGPFRLRRGSCRGKAAARRAGVRVGTAAVGIGFKWELA